MEATKIHMGSPSTNSCDPELRPPLMTIFYSGKVNVYQNVPADKAKAIMLLLSKDCSKIESSCANNISTGKPSPISIFSNKVPRAGSCTNSATSNNCSLPPRPAPSAASISGAIVTHITSPLPPRPPSVASGAIVTHIPSTPPGGQMKPRHGPTIKRSQAELPFARKASLTRFLQKRKDRVDARLHTESVRCSSTDDLDYDLISANVEESEGINPNKKKKN